MGQTTVRSAVKHLAGSSLIYGLGSVLLKALSFFLLPLYTRYLTPSDYGIIGVTTTITVVLGLLYPLSLHGALARFFFDAKTDAERRENVGTLWAAMILFAGVLAVVLDRTGDGLFSLVFRELPFDPYIRLAVWTAFFSTFGLLPLNLLQIRERPALYVLTTAVTTLLTIGLIIWFVVFQRFGAFGYLLGIFIANVATIAPFIILIVPHARITLRWHVLRAALAYSVPLVPHGLASWILDLSDRTILEHYVTKSDLGLYSLGYQIGALMTIGATAINNAWVPYLFKTDAEQGESAKARIARLTTYYALGLCWVALGLSLFAKELLALLTAPDFHSADRIVPWVAWGLFFSGLYFVPVNFLFVKAKTAYVPLATVVAGVGNIALNLWLIPIYGVMAAAWTTLLSYIVMLVLVWALALRVYPLTYEYARLFKMAFAAILILLVGAMIPTMDLAVSVALKGGLVLVFPLILFAMRFFIPAEIAWAIYATNNLRRRVRP